MTRYKPGMDRCGTCNGLASYREREVVRVPREGKTRTEVFWQHVGPRGCGQFNYIGEAPYEAKFDEVSA